MRRLNILVVHNRYLMAGGEDQVFESETKLLRERGHQVTQLEEQNTNPDTIQKKIGTAIDCVWSRRWHREFRTVLRRVQPDLVHVHNFFPRFSPSIYYACRREHVPVVQTLHNYRLICSSAILYRDGKVCEECLQHGMLRGVRYGCYQGSKLGSATINLMVGTHRALKTWSRMVDCYIALTQFARAKLIEGGLPAARIRVKPNFVLPDPGARKGTGNYAMFVGRLVESKGLPTLLAAWGRLSDIPLLIAGDGPYRQQLESELNRRELPSVRYLGRLSRPDTLAAMKDARLLVFPSEWYEGFPVTIAEAFACGVPVVCSRLGSMQEIVSDGRTGLHFEAGDAEDLASKVRWAWNHPQEIDAMGVSARQEFEQKYTAERNITMLEEAYQFAMKESSQTAKVVAAEVTPA